MSTILYTKYGLKVSRIDLYIPTSLREQQRTIQHGRLVVAPIIVLQFGLYLADLQILFQKTLELWQTRIIGKLCYIHACEIEFVSQENSLLLMHLGFGHQRTHKDILSGHIARFAWLTRSTSIIGRTRISCTYIIWWKYRDTHAIRSILITIYLNSRRRNSICSFLLCLERIGISQRKRGCTLAINKRSRRRLRSIRSCNILKIRKLRRSQIFRTLVDRITQLEWLTSNDLSGCRGFELYPIRGKCLNSHR